MRASVSSRRVNRRSAFSGVSSLMGSSAGRVCTGGFGHGPFGVDHNVAGSPGCFFVTHPLSRSEPTASLLEVTWSSARNQKCNRCGVYVP